MTKFAIVRSGHDRGHLYCVIHESDTSVQLVNGITRKIENPKQKNKKHIQIIKNIPIDIERLCMDGQGYSNEGIIEALECYKNL